MPRTREDEWPELPYEVWRDTRWTLHMYLQVIGKVRLALSPMEPEWANVPLYVTARGLNTSPIPHANGVFDIDVDFIDHITSVRTAAGMVERIRLEPKTVAEFDSELMEAMARAGVRTEISTTPTEVPFTTPYTLDVEHRSYEREWVNRYWRALVTIDAVMKDHRRHFRGKVSPVHFFWGSMDLACTRYSGRVLEPPEGAGVIARYGADAEQACSGFWPGDEKTRAAGFFAYTYPAPPGIEDASVQPAAAGWLPDLGEFVLSYDTVRAAADPRAALLAFFESTFQAGAQRADWPRELVEPT